ncbi:MAG: GNAT family N-acetyltransferase [Bacteroides sp.]|nr:GNAT family N-acetyltransferase [Eubacterium sp.]MCM1417257.1 GNAT family N-acetyltransferase [Roseburia sp.]MCM1461123.1 GNAT family N-acetyltransferase [Bacteroides sp.]
MNCCGTRIIETDRLILRRFEVSDAALMYRNWASDPEGTKFLTWKPHKDEEETRALLSEWVADYERSDCYNWIIVLKGERAEPVGSISVVRIEETTRCMTIGYCIGKAWWRREITSEALDAVIDHLFKNTDVLRIESYHDSDNPNSGGVMKKCGMKYEGTLRGHDLNNRGIVDACYYSILRDEPRERLPKKINEQNHY